MNILEALKQEESKLELQLTAVQGAIAALNGSAKTAVTPGHASNRRGTKAGRTLSAAARAKMSRAAKVRWAKVRAERAKVKR
jgi:hypothetical protein